MTTDKLTIGVDAVGAAKAAAEIDKVTGAVKKSVVATAESTKATQAQTLQIGQLGSTLGLAGQALGRVNPQIGQLTTMAGSATGVIQSLTSVGLGPMGVALGAVSLAVTAGVSVWKSYSEEQEKAQRTIRGTVSSLDELIARTRQSREETERSMRMGSGRGTADEYGAAALQSGEEAARARRELVAARASGTGGDLAGWMRRVRDAEAAVRQAEQARTQAESTATQSRRDEGYYASQRAEVERMQQETRDFGGSAPSRGGGRGESQSDRMTRLMGGAFRRNSLGSLATGLNLGSDDDGSDKAARNASYTKERADAEAEAFMSAERSKTEFLAEQKRERDELTMAEAQKGIEVWGAYGESLGNVFGQALMSEQNVGKALQNGLKAWAKGFAIQEIGKGMSATAEGIGAATNPITAAMAPGYFAAAGQHFAAAAVVGAIGVAIPSAGGGGNRGGSGGSARIPSEHNAMRSGGGSQTVVINMSGPIVATSDRAALGRELNALVGEGQRRYGAA